VVGGGDFYTPPVWNMVVEYLISLKEKLKNFFVGNKSKYVGISNENIVNRYH